MQDLAQLRLGFLGTGTITSAIVTGLCASAETTCPIFLSPRNERIAAQLASAFPQVKVAASNQDLIDNSDVVFIAVRPQIAKEVLEGVQFRAAHHVISLVATFSRDRIASLVRPAQTVACAVPLPMVAKHLGPTAIFPPDPIAARLFNLLGVAVEVASEEELRSLWAATSFMATHFTVLDTVSVWLTRHDVPPSRARAFVAMMFDGLGRLPRSSQAPFAQLAEDFATRGGLNEQCAAQLRQAGVFDDCAAALDAVLRRINAGGDLSLEQATVASGKDG